MKKIYKTPSIIYRFVDTTPFLSMSNEEEEEQNEQQTETYTKSKGFWDDVYNY